MASYYEPEPPDPPRPPSRVRLSTDRTALIVALIAAFASAAGPLFLEAVKDEQPSVNCFELAESIAQAIDSSPGARERYLPGVDGRSQLLENPQTIACRIGPEDFPVPPPTAEANPAGG